MSDFSILFSRMVYGFLFIVIGGALYTWTTLTVLRYVFLAIGVVVFLFGAVPCARSFCGRE